MAFFLFLWLFLLSLPANRLGITFDLHRLNIVPAWKAPATRSFALLGTRRFPLQGYQSASSKSLS